MDLGRSSDDSWTRNTLDVDALEDAISKLHLFGGEREFNTLLQTQVANCDRFYNAVITELILKNSIDQGRITEGVPVKLTNDIIRLDEFGNNNVMILVNMLKAHDEESQYSLMPSYQWKIQRNDFCSPEALDPLLLRLSSQYAMLRELKAPPLAPKPSPPGFSDATIIKCWVQNDNVIKTICEVVKHIPIETSGMPNRISQQTKHVYYDDDRFSLYSLKLVKEENSALIRFSWTGELTRDSEVVVEKRVHQDQYTPKHNQTSSFSLREDNVHGFVTGKYQPTADFLSRHPSFVEIQQMIVNDGLKPCLQTQYSRAGFKKDDDDSVRVHLDTNVVMLKESNVDVKTAWRKKDSNPEEEVHRFPFAILEVKVRGHLLSDPTWVDQLMHSGLVIRVDRFSKYTHGVAYVYRDDVQALPYWLADTLPLTPDDPPSEVKDPLMKSIPSQIPPGKGTSMYSRTLEKKRAQEPSRQPKTQRTTPSACSRCCTFMRKILTCSCCRKAPTTTNPKNNEARLRVEPKTHFANERTYLQWFLTAIFLGVISVSYIVSERPNSVILGRVLLPLSAGVGIYSLVVFHWRTEMLMRRQPSATYADRFGPTVLTCLFVAILIYSIVQSPNNFPLYHWVSPPEKPAGSRLSQMISRCTLNIQMSTPPEGKFLPTGMTFIDQTLYVADEQGRLGSLRSMNFNVQKMLSLPPIGPMQLTGLSSLPTKTTSISASVTSSVLYAIRQNPLSVIEINVRSGLLLRSFPLSDVADAVGLAIVPSSNSENYLFYTSSTDGSLSYTRVPLSGSGNALSTRVDPSVAGFLANERTGEAPILMFFQGHLYAYFHQETKVFSLDAQGLPSGLVNGQSLVFPALSAFAVSADGKQAYVATSDEKLVDMRFNAEEGFEFCP